MDTSVGLVAAPGALEAGALDPLVAGTLLFVEGELHPATNDRQSIIAITIAVDFFMVFLLSNFFEY